jgi:hypothetical protein
MKRPRAYSETPYSAAILKLTLRYKLRFRLQIIQSSSKYLWIFLLAFHNFRSKFENFATKESFQIGSYEKEDDNHDSDAVA